ncbi:testicular haploid expressed gene protein-like [Melanaphis sacchari]|uniref:testicular haploid expressed gene protein-like n=1 Tax=Melanaphis sacchari TaxID=742174 RepID=UPI000DC12DB0|nr:testicular haploid expressed gene protein-like [Melanaphis sacchari]
MNGTQKIYQPSLRIEQLAKPLARRRKPLIVKEVNSTIPWCIKGPDPLKRTMQVISPPPPRATTETGVSSSALRYEASENIKRLAKPRKIPKKEDKECFTVVKPLLLNYKPSLRILQLAKPQRVMKT